MSSDQPTTDDPDSESESHKDDPRHLASMVQFSLSRLSEALTSFVKALAESDPEMKYVYYGKVIDNLETAHKFTGDALESARRLRANADVTEPSVESESTDTMVLTEVTADEEEHRYFECPECESPVCSWCDCPDCGWYDEEVWEVTLSDNECNASS